MPKGREVAEQGSPEFTDGSGHARNDPVRRSLEYSEVLRYFRNLWSNLRCCRAIADQSDSLVFEIVGPIPPCRMHLLPGKGVKAFDVGISGDVKLAFMYII